MFPAKRPWRIERDSGSHLGGLRCSRAGGGKSLGQEGAGERFLEIEDLRKILAAIGLLFAEDLFLDQKEHHVADILAFSHPPFAHEGGAHGAKLFQSEIAVSFKQLRAADVTRLTAISLRDALEREVERVFQKEISMRIKALVAFQDGNDGLFELHCLHAETMQKQVWVVKELSQRRWTGGQDKKAWRAFQPAIFVGLGNDYADSHHLSAISSIPKHTADKGGEQILDRIASIASMLTGTLTEEFRLGAIGKDGKPSRLGPYYKLQGWFSPWWLYGS